MAEPTIEVEPDVADLDMAEPSVAGSDIAESQASENTVQPKLQKTCLFMLKILRRLDVRFSRETLKEFARELNMDVTELRNMYSTILTSKKLEDNLSRTDPVQNFQLRERQPEHVGKKAGGKAGKKAVKRIASQPEGKLSKVSRSTSPERQKSSFVKNPNYAPMGPSKLKEQVNHTADDLDMELDRVATEELACEDGPKEHMYEQSATVVVDHNMHPARAQFLLSGSGHQWSGEAAFRPGLPQQQDNHLLDQIEADLERTRQMFDLDEDHLP